MGLVEFPRMLFLNTDWLEELGLEMPTTVEEYHEVLLAFKEDVPGGVLPLSFIEAGDIADLIAAIGGQPDNADHRIVEDGKVVFTANTEGFRDAIAELHTWYDGGAHRPGVLLPGLRQVRLQGEGGPADPRIVLLLGDPGGRRPRARGPLRGRADLPGP